MIATTESGKESGKLIEEIQENETIKAYALISIGELRDLLKLAKEKSREVYDGKIRKQSTIGLDVTVKMERKWATSRNELQADVRKRFYYR